MALVFKNCRLLGSSEFYAQHSLKYPQTSDILKAEMLTENELFDRLLELLSKSQSESVEKADRGLIYIPSGLMNRGGEALFASLAKGGFATFVVSGRAQWNPKSTYFETAREAARKGRKITRLFLLPNRLCLRDPVVREHWELDRRAGIDVQFALVGGWLLEHPIPKGTLDFGLWDDQIACFVYRRPLEGIGSSHEWCVSKRPEDLEAAVNMRDSLLAHRTYETPATMKKQFALEEPMLKTAPLMRMLSEVLCKGDYVSRENCAWYHGSWQYLRILDLVSTPTWHQEFYKKHIAVDSIRGRAPLILICGTADYSMLAHLLWVLQERSKQCKITVLDLCNTPLWLSQWYAVQKGQEIVTVAEDIMKYKPDFAFDLIVTDAFLTRFSQNERREILLRWRDILIEKGKLVTTVRLEEGSERVKASSDQVDLFVDKARELGARWQDFLPISVDELAVLAGKYAERIDSCPVPNAVTLRKELEACDFSVEHLTERLLKGEMKPTRYAEVVASKRKNPNTAENEL